jgi:hypothetical protein
MRRFLFRPITERVEGITTVERDVAMPGTPEGDIEWALPAMTQAAPPG